MKKFYNGKEINKNNLIDLMSNINSSQSDLWEQTERIFEFISTNEYNGKDDDLQFICDKLKDCANLKDVEDIICNGEWYYQLANHSL
jgi:hypothetical protein